MMNKTAIRTDDEIVARIKELEADDFFGWERGDLLNCLPFETATQFLKEGATPEGWKVLPRDRVSVVARMLDYMPFAWEKAKDCRGISASRSMSHFSAWTWLIDDDFGDLQDYEYYGKDNLVKICKHYGWDASQWDDGRRVNSESEL